MKIFLILILSFFSGFFAEAIAIELIKIKKVKKKVKKKKQKGS